MRPSPLTGGVGIAPRTPPTQCRRVDLNHASTLAGFLFPSAAFLPTALIWGSNRGGACMSAWLGSSHPLRRPSGSNLALVARPALYPADFPYRVLNQHAHQPNYCRGSCAPRPRTQEGYHSRRYLRHRDGLRGRGNPPSNHWPESMIRRISFTAFSKAAKSESEKSISPTSSTYPAAVL